MCTFIYFNSFATEEHESYFASFFIYIIQSMIYRLQNIQSRFIRLFCKVLVQSNYLGKVEMFKIKIVSCPLQNIIMSSLLFYSQTGEHCIQVNFCKMIILQICVICNFQKYFFRMLNNTQSRYLKHDLVHINVDLFNKY